MRFLRLSFLAVFSILLNNNIGIAQEEKILEWKQRYSSFEELNDDLERLKFKNHFPPLTNKELLNPPEYSGINSWHYTFDRDQINEHEYLSHKVSCISPYLNSKTEEYDLTCYYVSKIEIFVRYNDINYQIQDGIDIELAKDIIEAWHNNRVNWVYRLETSDRNISADQIKYAKQNCAYLFRDDGAIISKGADYYRIVQNRYGGYGSLRFHTIHEDGIIYLNIETACNNTQH